MIKSWTTPIPRHGGRDPGTMYKNILEKDINLSISKILKKNIEKSKAKVYLTRKDDTDLSLGTDNLKKRSDLLRRIYFIENKKSDLYLSIHINWYNNSYYKGAEVLYNNINKKNKLLAQSITDSFKQNNIKTRNITPTNLYIYRNTYTPGVLIECGFLSNSDERYLLQTKSYQEKISKAITEGIKKYLYQT